MTDCLGGEDANPCRRSLSGSSGIEDFFVEKASVPALGLSRLVAYGLGVSHTMNDGSISTELDQFFGAYFHQDWDLEADDWQGIVDNYVAEDPTPGPLLRLAEEIDDLRRSGNEAELKEFLVRQVGVDYGPARRGAGWGTGD